MRLLQAFEVKVVDWSAIHEWDSIGITFQWFPHPPNATVQLRIGLEPLTTIPTIRFYLYLHQLATSLCYFLLSYLNQILIVCYDTKLIHKSSKHFLFCPSSRQPLFILMPTDNYGSGFFLAWKSADTHSVFFVLCKPCYTCILVL